jgi:hypothetical protein
MERQRLHFLLKKLQKNKKIILPVIAPMGGAVSQNWGKSLCLFQNRNSDLPERLKSFYPGENPRIKGPNQENSCSSPMWGAGFRTLKGSKI